MGAATIASEIGEGLYEITLDYGSATLAAKIAKLDAQIARYEALIPDLEANLSAARFELLFATNALDPLISAYQATVTAEGGDDEKREAVEAQILVVLNARVEVQARQFELAEIKGKLATATASKSYYEGFELTNTVEAWCVTYTLEAEGPVGTIEIPGEPVTTVLVPGCAAPQSSDGEVTARVVQDAGQLFVNLALLPGWQKYTPTYRLGTISNIDKAAHTCDLELDAATSSAQSLDINQETSFTEVPIVYGSCNSLVFEEDDRVVVRFVSNDWEQPRVIGFESNPRPCYPLEWNWHTLTTSATPGLFQSHLLGEFIEEEPYGFAAEIRALIEDKIDPDPYPSLPANLTEYQYWVKPPGGAWIEIPFTAPPGNQGGGGAWLDARGTNPSWEWLGWGIAWAPFVGGGHWEEYAIWFYRDMIFGGYGEPEADAVFVQLYAQYWESPTVTYDKTGWTEFFVRRVSDSQTVFHVAIDPANKQVFASNPEDCRYVLDGSVQLPSYATLTYGDYTLDDPP